MPLRGKRSSVLRSNYVFDLGGAKRARTADLLHAIWRQHVHPRPYPQVIVPASTPRSTGIRTRCCTSMLYRCHPRREHQSCPDKALTSANPAHQVTGAPSGVHVVKEATEARPSPLPCNLTLHPMAGQPDSPTNIRPGIPKVAQQLPLLADERGIPLKAWTQCVHATRGSPGGQ